MNASTARTAGANSRVHVLVVEDEPDLAEVVAYNLSARGMSTEIVGSVGAARRRLLQKPRPALVVLDLMLPDAPGTELCRWVKQDPQLSDIAILVASAKDDEIDRIVGFELGADDYLVKPYSVRELVLRAEAILRRMRRPPDPEQLDLGRLRLNRPAHAAWADGRRVALTPKEFDLLWVLARAQGRVVARDELLSALGEESDDIESRRVDARVRRLRVKLGSAAELLETIRGVGHRIAADQLQREPTAPRR